MTTKLHNLRWTANQLRKPHGLLGKEVGRMMNKGNGAMNLSAIRQLRIKPNDNILEIGMGNGFFVKEIVSNNKSIRYCGCDFSETMIKEAILLNGEYIVNGQVCFVKANAAQLPFEDETFGKIFTVNTIYFWDDIKTVISEINRVLQKEGLLVLSLRPKSVMDQLPIIQYGFQMFSKDDCIHILRSNGFKILTVTQKEDKDIELSGTKYKNAFMVIKAIKK